MFVYYHVYLGPLISYFNDFSLDIPSTSNEKGSYASDANHKYHEVCSPA